MPTYQYSCTECGTPLEVVQSFSDAALTTCPTCGGRLRKVFSAVGVVFKGSGFYRTDSRESAKSASGKGSAEAGASSGAEGKAAAADGGSSGSSPGTTGDGKGGSTKPATSAPPSDSGSKQTGAAKKPQSTSSSGSSAA